MPKPLITFLDRATLRDAIVIPTPDHPHRWENFDHTHESQVFERLQHSTIAITNKVILNPDSLQKLPQLKHIIVAATGTDTVNLQACREYGITVSNVRGYALDSVSEHTFAMIFALSRQLSQYKNEIAQGYWQKQNQFCYFNSPIANLKGKTLGVVGTGSIAKAVTTMAKALGMNTIAHSLSGRGYVEGLTLVSRTSLLKSADIISLHCPLNAHSHHFINKETLKHIKPDAILINTARGDVIDLDALLKTVEEKQIYGVGLDVTPEEPPQKSSAAMKLVHHPNVIITPHVAWSSNEAMNTLAKQITENINAFLEGKACRLVL